jgi:hypothetical protein
VNHAAVHVFRALCLVDLDFLLTSADFGENVALRFLRWRLLQEQEWLRVLELLRAQPPVFRRNLWWFLRT